MNLVGVRFDRLMVTAKLGMTPSGARWLCACDCGGSAERLTTQLRRKGAKRKACPDCITEVLSAGNTRHGGRRQNTAGTESLYATWKTMRARCSDPANPYYGAKGVTVCPEWSDYAAFRAWAIGAGYRDIQGVTRGDRMSIDRINPALGYSPANCAWIPMRENSRRMASRIKAA